MKEKQILDIIIVIITMKTYKNGSNLMIELLLKLMKMIYLKKPMDQKSLQEIHVVYSIDKVV